MATVGKARLRARLDFRGRTSIANGERPVTDNLIEAIGKGQRAGAHALIYVQLSNWSALLRPSTRLSDLLTRYIERIG